MAGGLCNIHRFYVVVICLFLNVVYCAVKQTISWLWPVVNKLTTIQEGRNVDGIVDGRVFSDVCSTSYVYCKVFDLSLLMREGRRRRLAYDQVRRPDPCE